jgi:glutaminyl-peptide cyclotransferase
MRAHPWLLAATALAACGGPPAPQPEFDAAVALARIEAQVAFGPRIPGTAGHVAMAGWLDSLARMGSDSVVVQRWTHLSADGDSLPMVNVIARFNPAARDRLLYLAHWDTRPSADSPTSSDPLAPVPGANDGGSGVAILLGVMDALQRSPLPADAGVDLLFVDGEDYGAFGPPPVDVLIGSSYYASNALPPARPDFAVLWDMVGGRDARFKKEQYSMIAAPDVVARVWRVAEQMGYGSVFMDADLGAITDDHVPLINAGIRAIDVIGWGDPHWHTPDDTPDKISTETLAAAGNVAIGVIRLWVAER